MNPSSAQNTGSYEVLAGTKKKKSFVYKKPIFLSSAIPSGSSVKLLLLKPFKGTVEVIVRQGILAANGAATSTDESFPAK